MSLIDKVKNKLQMAKGHGKEQAGHATGNPDLEAQGRSDRVEGGAKQAGEHVKDVGKDIKDSFKK
ncbi:MAG TPA: CsbD family protein [Actinoallomurus sp.]|jgi:uncharacterized protein YjbJ (UPF0337 family)